jgi:hypothetical protein
MKRGWTRDEDEILRGYWAQGLQAKEVGRLMGKTHHQVYGRVKRMKLPPHTKRPSGMNAEIVRLAIERKGTYTQIGAQFGITKNVVAGLVYRGIRDAARHQA